MARPLFLEQWWIETLLGSSLREERWEKGGVTAYWPMESRTRFGLKILNTPDLAPYLGPWFDFPEDVGTFRRDSYLKEGVNALFQSLTEHDVLLGRLHPEFGYYLPFVWNGCHLSPRITYRLRADLTLDEVNAGMKPSNRYNIKKALKCVTLSEAEDVSVLWELSVKTFDRQGRQPPFSKDDLYRIYRACLERGRVQLIQAADPGGRVHSAAMFLHDSDHVYYYKGGSDPEYRNSEAFSAIIWEGIRWSRELGLGFDFGGSMLEPVERFFRTWGAERVTYYEFRRFRNKRVKALYFFRDPDRF